MYCLACNRYFKRFNLLYSASGFTYSYYRCKSMLKNNNKQKRAPQGEMARSALNCLKYVARPVYGFISVRLYSVEYHMRRLIICPQTLAESKVRN